MDHESPAPDIEKIRSLIQVMEQRGLSRLTLTENGVTIRLEASPSVAPPAAWPAPMGAYPLAAPARPIAGSTADEVEPEPEGVPLLSPTTGTFYRAPAPGEPPFVDVGDMVEVGQTIGIIMAMKVMSEIPAEVAGSVVAIPPADGELVQVGSVLLVVSPSD